LSVAHTWIADICLASDPPGPRRFMSL